MTIEKTDARVVFGAMVAKMRKDQKMTQRELARRARVPAPHMCQLEKGLRPCGATLANRLMQVLNIQDRVGAIGFMGAADKTVSKSRMRTVKLRAVAMFMRGIEFQLRRLAGENFEKVLFHSSFSVAGTKHPPTPSSFLMLDDGNRVSATISVTPC